MSNINNKILLVTGASSDIGDSLIRKIAGNYSLIWVHYNSSDSLIKKLHDDIGDKILPVQADFSDEESINNLVNTISSSGNYPDHIVLLSALKVFNQRFHKLSWADFQAGIDVSLKSAVIITNSFIPAMIKKKYGKIEFMLSSVTIGSLPPKYQSAYVTVKYALSGLMKSLAAEYAEKGIMINAVSPDMIATKFLKDISDIVIEQNRQQSPLNRILNVDDIVPTFEFLLSDTSDAMTGQNLGITGGVR